MSSHYLCSTTFVEGRIGRIILLEPKDKNTPYYYEFQLDVNKPIKNIVINHNQWLGTNFYFELTKTSDNRWQLKIYENGFEIWRIINYEPIRKLKQFRGDVIRYVDLWYVDFQRDFPQERGVMERFDNLSTAAEECRFKTTGREEELIRVWYINPRFKEMVREFIEEGVTEIPRWIDISKQTELKPCLATLAPAVILWHSDTRKEKDYRYRFNIPKEFKPTRAIINKSAVLLQQGYQFSLFERKLAIYRADPPERDFELWIIIENGSNQLIRIDVLGTDGITRNVTINEIELLDDTTDIQLNSLEMNDPLYTFNMQVFGPWCIPINHQNEIGRIPQYNDFV